MANNWDVQSFVQLHLQGMAKPKLPGTEYIYWETHLKKMYWAALVVQWLAESSCVQVVLSLTTATSKVFQVNLQF